MTVRAEEISSVADLCRLTIRGIKLPNKDSIFGKSDPFLTIARARENNEWQQVLWAIMCHFLFPPLQSHTLLYAVFPAYVFGGAHQFPLFIEQRNTRWLWFEFCSEVFCSHEHWN